MPLYVFQCTIKKCKTEVFEVLCRRDEIEKVVCPGCDSKKIEKLLTTPNVQFTNPQNSSKWDSFTYRAGYNLDKAKGDRRNAQAQSHVGATPYEDTERVDLENYDMNNHEGEVT